ncbi:MAG TPA: GyrI-like domain-containing protein [Bacillales bacterium]
MGVLGACMEFEFKQENAVEFTYFIGIEQEKNAEPTDWEVKEIPAATWAAFECVGPMPDAIQKLTEQIHSEWLPASDYEHAGTPELEVYSPGDPADQNYRSQVWIPVMEKE